MVFIYADTIAPTPDPMTFASAPSGASATSIAMTASTASDATSTPVAYLFGYYSCGTPDAGTGGADSSWQSSADYTNSGLEVNKCYGYEVQARDAAAIPNETASSSQSNIYTLANTPGTPTLGSPSATTLTLGNEGNGNPALNPTTKFAVQIVNTSPLDSTWENQYVDATGDPSATAVWLSDAQLDAIVITGLSAETTYGAQSKARNENSFETSFSSIGSNTTGSAAAAAPRTVRLLGHVRLRGGVRLR